MHVQARLNRVVLHWALSKSMQYLDTVGRFTASRLKKSVRKQSESSYNRRYERGLHSKENCEVEQDF